MSIRRCLPLPLPGMPEMLTCFPDLRLNAEVHGPENGPPVVFPQVLGTRLRIWDGVIPLLPPTCRILALDMRGHGASDSIGHA